MNHRDTEDTEKRENKITFREAWGVPPREVVLGRDEVDVWAVGLEQSDAVAEWLAATLSADERERAGKFYFEKHRREYVVARGALRNILGRYLRCEAESLEFVYSASGKPGIKNPYPDWTEERFAPEGFHSPIQSPLSLRVRGEDKEADLASDSLQFNLSHSGQVALYAVTRGRRVGIDIEAIRKLDDLDGLARSNFSAAENATLKSLPENLKQEAFFNCWTRKEAYIKALGDGLAYPLDQFDVTLKPGEEARLVKVASDPQEATRWRLEALDVAAGYAAAVIVEGQDWKMRTWGWDTRTDL